MAARTDRRDIEKAGRRAEMLAGLLLRLKGYRVLTRRFRSRRGEVDLIACRRGLLVAVEVKQRQSEAAAREAITARQRQRIAGGIEDWSARTGHTGPVRFDAILILPRRLPIHIKDAWRLT
ncbi:YraN family protein [Gimibacter soli]|uniref:UPF0102 protein PH603_02235 n=1 Tax=Gimibacter soli TaxID=3024400 RepID=A0AAE9XU71_9PROT|nr:YraN family protein [Gimibacter soli]WCL54575.1 YraN family protein [Gimibacter soli]